MKKKGPPVRDLRDLARKIRHVAERHFCYGQVSSAVAQFEDHIVAIAGNEEKHREIERLRAEIERLRSSQALRGTSA